MNHLKIDVIENPFKIVLKVSLCKKLVANLVHVVLLIF